MSGGTITKTTNNYNAKQLAAREQHARGKESAMGAWQE